MALITKTELKAYLKIAVATIEFDDLLTDLCYRVQVVIEQYINDKLDETSYFQLYNGDGESRLMLDHKPIITMERLSSDIDYSTLYLGEVYDLDILLTDKEEGIIELYDDVFPEGKRNIYVSYTAGYTDETMPKDLKHAALEIAAKAFNDIKDQRIGITSKNVMNDTINYYLEPLAIHKTILEHRRKIPGRNGMDCQQLDPPG